MGGLGRRRGAAGCASVPWRSQARGAVAEGAGWRGSVWFSLGFRGLASVAYSRMFPGFDVLRRWGCGWDGCFVCVGRGGERGTAAVCQGRRHVQNSCEVTRHWVVSSDVLPCAPTVFPQPHWRVPVLTNMCVWQSGMLVPTAQHPDDTAIRRRSGTTYCVPAHCRILACTQFTPET